MLPPRTTTLAHRSKLAGLMMCRDCCRHCYQGASLTPTGTPDTARSSQYLQALQSLFINGTLGTADGNIPQIGTPGTTSLGTRSAVVVRSGSNANGNFRVYSDGLIIQWGIVSGQSSSTGQASFSRPFAIGFSVTPLMVSTAVSGLQASGNQVPYAAIRNVSTSTADITLAREDGLTLGFAVNYIAIGF